MSHESVTYIYIYYTTVDFFYMKYKPIIPKKNIYQLYWLLCRKKKV